MISARVLAASGLRDLAAALPSLGDDAARLARMFPSRAFVIEGMSGDDARVLAGRLQHGGAAACALSDAVAVTAGPEALAAVLGALKSDDATREVFDAVSLALARWGEPAHDIPLPNGHALQVSQRVHVMGIVNVTPDSFSDGGRFLDADAAIAHGLQMVEDGADILDVGAESTRPGASPVSQKEELHRLLPVVEALAAKVTAPVSVDTTKSAVAAAALDGGAQIVNDVSAGSHDPAMFEVVAQRRAAYVLMHMRGEPRTMQKDIRYRDVVGEIAQYLGERAEMAVAAGLARDAMIVDPGFGFGKLPEHNLVLLRRLREFRCLGFPILAGTSRKTFIGRTLDDAPPEDRLEGTAATVALAVTGGASIVRVHDVRAMRRVVDMVEATLNAREPGDR
ncbi:MAG: dihydropteroate synthase [Actinomycetota bacterium]|nr:dihydropteroate synthase [Actinomycetota bacterium]